MKRLITSTKSASFLLIGAWLLLSPLARACDSHERAGTLDLSTATLDQLTVALEQKKVSSVDLVRGYLLRIQNCDQRLHAIIATNPNALRDAEQLDAERKAGKIRGPLHGIPTSTRPVRSPPRVHWPSPRICARATPRW